MDVIRAAERKLQLEETGHISVQHISQIKMESRARLENEQN